MAEKRRKSLLEMMEEENALEEQQNKEATLQNTGSTGKKTSVLTIADDRGKNKQISAKVNEKLYNIFTEINQKQGLSNNSAINMILTKYVREYKGILEDDYFI